MSPDLGDTAYGEGQRLVCGAPGTYQGAVEACLLPDDEQETDAAWIAGRIADLVAAGEPVREGGAVRPVRYEDCCILLAARADFPVYTRALADRGIPVYADARENLFEAPHIRPLVALLKIIDNPAQDIYLAAAMLTSWSSCGPGSGAAASTARWRKWPPARRTIPSPAVCGASMPGWRDCGGWPAACRPSG